MDNIAEMSSMAQMALSRYRNITEGDVSVCPAGPSHQWVALQQAAAPFCCWVTRTLLQEALVKGGATWQACLVTLCRRGILSHQLCQAL